MGMSSSYYLFALLLGGIFVLLVREILLLQDALQETHESNEKLHQMMSEKLADVEVEKILLEDKINQMEETISLWQGQTRRLNRRVSILNNQLDNNEQESSDFTDDNKTRETVVKFRRRSAA